MCNTLFESSGSSMSIIIYSTLHFFSNLDWNIIQICMRNSAYLNIYWYKIVWKNLSSKSFIFNSSYILQLIYPASSISFIPYPVFEFSFSDHSVSFSDHSVSFSDHSPVSPTTRQFLQLLVSFSNICCCMLFSMICGAMENHFTILKFCSTYFYLYNVFTSLLDCSS